MMHAKPNEAIMQTPKPHEDVGRRKHNAVCGEREVGV